MYSVKRYRGVHFFLGPRFASGCVFLVVGTFPIFHWLGHRYLVGTYRILRSQDNKGRIMTGVTSFVFGTTFFVSTSEITRLYLGTVVHDRLRRAVHRGYQFHLELRLHRYHERVISAGFFEGATDLPRRLLRTFGRTLLVLH